MAFDSSGCGGSASIVHVFPDDYKKTGPTDDTQKKKGKRKKSIQYIYSSSFDVGRDPVSYFRY